MDFKQLYEAIAGADIITLYRHMRPDCDALGSQFGLKNWIVDNFPDKKVYALGIETSDQGEFPAADTATDEEVRNSIAIVLDTATKERADDQRFLSARQIIRIDHHPLMQEFGDLLFINDKAAATCEILAGFFQSCSSIVSLQTAEYLYMGLLTDTMSFSTSNTTADTLKAAAYLAGFSIDIPVINHILFDKDRKDFDFEGFLHEHAVIEDRMAYAIITKEDQDRWQMANGDVRNYVDVFSQVRDFEVWAIFNEKETEEGRLYDGSLRSRRVVINEIARMFSGGGHKNASGVKNMTLDEVYDLIAKLKKAIRKSLG